MKRASLRSLIVIFNISLVVGLVLNLAACSDDGGSEVGNETDSETTDDAGTETGDESLAIVGEYIDDFMTMHSITEEQWSFSGSLFAIVEFDNDAMYLVAQNDQANMFNPGLWSRFDWTWDGDQLYFCQIIYDGATIEDARAGSADPNDLATGCNGFAWSMLDPQ